MVSCICVMVPFSEKNEKTSNRNNEEDVSALALVGSSQEPTGTRAEHAVPWNDRIAVLTPEAVNFCQKSVQSLRIGAVTTDICPIGDNDKILDRLKGHLDHCGTFAGRVSSWNHVCPG
jgi:hypothetical protein